MAEEHTHTHTHKITDPQSVCTLKEGKKKRFLAASTSAPFSPVMAEPLPDREFYSINTKTNKMCFCLGGILWSRKGNAGGHMYEGPKDVCVVVGRGGKNLPVPGRRRTRAVQPKFPNDGGRGVQRCFSQQRSAASCSSRSRRQSHRASSCKERPHQPPGY